MIAVGHTYVKQFNTDGDEAWNYKSHELCHSIFVWCWYEYQLDEYDWGVQGATEELAEWWFNLMAVFQGRARFPGPMKTRMT